MRAQTRAQPSGKAHPSALDYSSAHKQHLGLRSCFKDPPAGTNRKQQSSGEMGKGVLKDWGL